MFPPQNVKKQPQLQPFLCWQTPSSKTSSNHTRKLARSALYALCWVTIKSPSLHAE